MKKYNFLAINPYEHSNKPLEVKLPDDMKLCMNYQYPDSKQQFWIFFYPYDEWLCGDREDPQKISVDGRIWVQVR